MYISYTYVYKYIKYQYASIMNVYIKYIVYICIVYVDKYTESVQCICQHTY